MEYVFSQGTMNCPPHGVIDCPVVPTVALPQLGNIQKTFICMQYFFLLQRYSLGEDKTVGCRYLQKHRQGPFIMLTARFWKHGRGPPDETTSTC